MSRYRFEGWIYEDRNGRRVGPITSDELKHAIARGELQRRDRVWKRWSNGEELMLPDIASTVYDNPAPAEPY
jgi:hypothetical protein